MLADALTNTLILLKQLFAGHRLGAGMVIMILRPPAACHRWVGQTCLVTGKTGELQA